MINMVIILDEVKMIKIIKKLKSESYKGYHIKFWKIFDKDCGIGVRGEVQTNEISDIQDEAGTKDVVFNNLKKRIERLDDNIGQDNTGQYRTQAQEDAYMKGYSGTGPKGRGVR